MSNMLETFSDFYQQLIQLIDQGQQQKALALFETLETEREQLTTLQQIATDLAEILKSAHDRARYLTVTLERDHNFAVALASAFARANHLIRDINHAHDTNRSVTRDHDLANDRTRDIVGGLTRELNRSFDLARMLAHVIERDTVFTHERDIASELSRARNQTKFILAVPIMQNEKT